MEQRCAACRARTDGLCGKVPETALTALGRTGQRKRLVAGETLIWQDDEAPPLANLLSGLLQISLSTADGRAQIVGLVRPGDLAGRPYGDRAPQTVTALTNAELCLFPRHAFARIAQTQPQLDHALLEQTLEALDRARAQMLSLARKAAGERVAALLLDLAAEDDEEINLPVSRQEMADILGLTIETVSRQLTRLESRGTIALSGRRGLSITSRSALEAAAGA
ncbi:Crp/Fnr family transcriptional regulator [Sphingosinicella sp. BN140058]|uniref:Crp/Fnr family transcriptional regulator n=1 Tax=Sphingosinicella sp. BN140058 TaxID=1892855 RepID=UPI00101065D7|nr:Crp/Fnr family transcriptional regulator [Sphingosinicella sp. BN140058]QAY78501.1 Crp/Fnr family transcriptional regulator [Sphingosinicella sp. BN140058]